MPLGLQNKESKQRGKREHSHEWQHVSPGWVVENFLLVAGKTRFLPAECRIQAQRWRTSRPAARHLQWCNSNLQVQCFSVSCLAFSSPFLCSLPRACLSSSSIQNKPAACCLRPAAHLDEEISCTL